MNRSMIKAMMLTFAEFGIKFENVENPADTETIYVSVPEKSELATDDGFGEGKNLAEKFTTAIKGSVGDGIAVKYRLRKGEIWTEKMSISASREMLATLRRYGF